MRQDDYKEIINDLKKEQEVNHKRISYWYDQMKKVRASRFENKVTITLVLSMIGYLGLFGMLVLLVKALGVGAIVNMIPVLGVSAILGVGSLGIGTFLRKLIDKGSNINKDYISKTEADKLSDEIYHQMELAKASNKNVVINRAIENVELAYSLSRKTEELKEMSDNKEKDIIINDKDFEVLLDKKYSELDMITMKKVLNERFGAMDSKFNRICLTCVNSTIFGVVLASLFYLAPTMLLSEVISVSSLYVGLSILVVGMISSGVYNIKNNLDYAKVLNELKRELNINDLGNNQELVSLIEKQIEDISNMEFKIKKQKTYSNKDLFNDDNKEVLFSYSFPKVEVNEQRKNMLEDLKQFRQSSSSSVGEVIHQSLEDEEKSVLVKKKKG